MLPHRELQVFSYFKDTPIDIQKRKGKMKEEKEERWFLNTWRRNKNYWQQDVRYRNTTGSLIHGGTRYKRERKTKTMTIPWKWLCLETFQGYTLPPLEITLRISKSRDFPFKILYFGTYGGGRSTAPFYFTPFLTLLFCFFTSMSKC